MNNIRLLPIALLSTVAWATWSQDQELYSGPLPGEPIVPFEVVAATGPERDTVVDYVTRFDGAPTVYCFVHNVSRASSRTVRALDVACAARADEGLRTLFVMLGSDQDETERYGMIFPGLLDLSSHVGISVDGNEGPGAWGLDRELVLTVTVAKGDMTVASFPLLSPNETDVPRIMEAVDPLLVELETFEDLRDEVLRLRQDVRALQETVAALTGGAAPAPSAEPDMMGGGMRGGARGALASEGAPTPLEERMRDLTAEGVTAQQARVIVAELRGMLELDPALAQRFLELAVEVRDAGHGTDAARRQIEALASELLGKQRSSGGGR